MKHIDGKHMFGTVKVGERGQIVIPKEARELFGIEAGDLLMVMGDENMGMIGITKADQMKAFAMKILAGFNKHNEEE